MSKGSGTRMAEVDYVIAGSAEELKSRILSQVDECGWFSIRYLFGPKAFVGRFSGLQFWIEKRRYYGNSFAPVFCGAIDEREGRCRVRGRFRMHPVTRIFQWIWFSILGVAWLVGIAVWVLYLVFSSDAFWRGMSRGELLIVVTTPLFLLILGLGIMRLGAWLSRSEKKAILGLLDNIFREK